MSAGRDGFIQGLEAALFALLGAEGDIDFLKFKLQRLIKENREQLKKEKTGLADD